LVASYIEDKGWREGRGSEGAKVRAVLVVDDKRGKREGKEREEKEGDKAFSHDAD
jgi:hypothetical protein